MEDSQEIVVKMIIDGIAGQENLILQYYNNNKCKKKRTGVKVKTPVIVSQWQMAERIVWIKMIILEA